MLNLKPISNSCQNLDRFWFLGWQITNRAICTRIALLWISTLTETTLLLIPRSQSKKANSKLSSRTFQLVWKIGISDAPNFFSEFFFPNSVLLCSFLGLWSRSINPPLQSLVNQDFSQTFERLFSKEEIWKQNPPRLKCSKMPRIWKEKSAEMSCVHFTRILGLVWHYFIKFEFWGIPSKCLENRRIFPGASLILGPWGSPRVAFQSEILYDYLIKTFSFNHCRILYRGNQLHQVF